jgi:hypothetical protein
MIAFLRAEIWTQDLPNTKQNANHSTTEFGYSTRKISENAWV